VDPVTLLGIATSSYQLLVKGFQAGKNIEDMGSSLSKWMGAISDIKHADQQIQNPSVFKKVFSGSSIEEEAMACFQAKKKAEQMEDDLRNFVNLTYGPSAWSELLRMQTQIRKKRQETVYRQEEERRKLFERSVYVFLFLIVAGFLSWVGYLVTLKMMEN
tara:strand:+ start:286 stop:765 length:480 start_codon:yes stop_codon:yes gene_type:complete